jgi:predicted PurR-regulated permease PerM
MSDERDEFIRRTGVVLRAVVFGVVLTAGVQGVLGAVGWWFVNLSSPLLAGALMALLAMIPFVGTPTVWVPGGIYLFLVGDVKKGLVLIFWGLCVVSAVDNFLRPYFISGKANMSALLVFLGAFGGLAAWGFIGLFVGPLILSLFAFSLDFYRKVWVLYQTDQTTQDVSPSVSRSVSRSRKSES